MSFERVIVLDWSAASRPARGASSIWIGEAARDASTASPPVNPRTRDAAMAVLLQRIDAALARGERLLIGVDFALGYPRGLAGALTGQPLALALWDWLEARIEDGADNANNRFRIAAEINARLPGLGPFWGCPPGTGLAGLPAQGRLRQGHGLPERRLTETHIPRAQPVWKLFTAGSVGGQTLLGIARMARLRRRLAGRLAVWPLEDCSRARVVLAEVYPSLLGRAVTQATGYPCLDAAQVDLLARALLSLGEGIAPLLAPDASPDLLREEGWILGAGHAERLKAALDPRPLTPPRLRDDCFAMPQGVAWVPVDEALARLRATLVPVTGREEIATAQAGMRVLAEPLRARRANPPAANSAVDGYGFAHAALTGPGPHTLPLVAGRAAAGQPLGAGVPAGQAVRILTGAILPEGVDTVVLEEDCASDGARVAFDGPVRARANTRRAGEDVAADAPVLAAGRVLSPGDLALLSALGVGRVPVHRRLRVAVLSTGDELLGDPCAEAAPHQIFDANRPMLLEILRRWGHVPVDLGHARDEPAAIVAAFDRAAAEADAVLTSGGASAGDEDHVSRLLRSRARLSSWRIALKPGRPLALALWPGKAEGQAVPVIGLPGNPVAALVCTLIFARPALSLLGGAGWQAPQGFLVPAAFAKSKKPGRREYLRARINAGGAAEVFASEGSGRISGLSWADGLVELPDAAATIAPGDAVRYLPFASFGLG
ncbi:MAG: molybdopterin-binding protein [Pararhodobacter sp.]